MTKYVNLRKNILDDKDIKRIVYLRNQGLSFKVIGERIGKDQSHLAKIYRDLPNEVKKQVWC